MKLHKNNLGMLERAKKTVLGRIVMRLAGEEKGAIMMEDVIVATLIAAAVAVGVWMFGAQILGMFQVAGDSVQGNDTAAQEKLDGNISDKPTQDQKTLDADKKKTISEAEDSVNVN